MANKNLNIFKKSLLLGTLALGTCLVVLGPVSFADEVASMGEGGEITLYRDMFDQVAYSEFINQLDFGRWGRKLFHKRIPSADVNIFDEVPDSTFFYNRHARQRLSSADLERGFSETDGPDLSKPLTVIAAEEQSSHYGFIVEDAKKDRYILRFDSQGASELNTAAAVIASRFYFAFGYNVLQTTLLSFTADQIVAGPEAIACDNSGFVKKLTPELLQQYLLFVPLPNGTYRASASKIPGGTDVGSFSFMGRAKKNANDILNHRDLREIRALGVFSSWLNHHEMLESSTLSFAVTENGKTLLKRYLGDFTNAFGAATDGAKAPMLGYEHMVDYGETFNAVLGLGCWEKPWQKKWRAAGEKGFSPGIGYFDNEFFDPAKFKNLLPYEAFRLVTRADGFWAAKIMMSLSNEDIRAMVKAGKYSRSEDEDYLVKILSERRDIIARYWFSVSNPLDQFAFSGEQLSFKDLAIVYGFASKDGTLYHTEVFSGNKKITTFESKDPAIKIQPDWLAGNSTLQLVFRTSRSASSKWSPSVTVLLKTEGIQGIRHED